MSTVTGTKGVSNSDDGEVLQFIGRLCPSYQNKTPERLTQILKIIDNQSSMECSMTGLQDSRSRARRFFTHHPVSGQALGATIK